MPVDRQREEGPATVQPTITGEQAGLWLYGSVLLSVYDDVDAANIAAMNINAASAAWMSEYPSGDAVVRGAVSRSVYPLPRRGETIYVAFTTDKDDAEYVPATLVIHARKETACGLAQCDRTCGEWPATNRGD